MNKQKPTVLIAGATGYLGRHLITAYHNAGYSVHALARNRESLSDLEGFIDEVFVGEATQLSSIDKCCNGIDLVVSALGITKQRDGLTYEQVDYQANRNLLDIAISAGVERFAYIHVLNAHLMPTVAMAQAKEKFASELEAASIASTILCPSGFFSDLSEIMDMAKKGKVYLLGDGASKLTPIHGADLAEACVEATTKGLGRIDVGGPETFTQKQLAGLAFEALGRPAQLVLVPVWVAKLAIRLAKLFGQTAAVGPWEFFIRSAQLDMSAPSIGTHRLIDDFRSQVAPSVSAEKPHLTLERKSNV